MTDFLDAVVSIHTLLITLLIFGVAPGFTLRIIVLAYPRDSPRRQELIAELYAIDRLQRPFWVSEQIETALFEGLGGRLEARKARQQVPIPPASQVKTVGVTSIEAFGAVWNYVMVAYRDGKESAFNMAEERQMKALAASVDEVVLNRLIQDLGVDRSLLYY